ncbi:MAG: hypothetical protein IPM29_10030 [Planctomycetes bacterium]|nr:hypothetical protein [Planctomycetota bacterium]
MRLLPILALGLGTAAMWSTPLPAQERPRPQRPDPLREAIRQVVREEVRAAMRDLRAELRDEIRRELRRSGERAGERNAPRWRAESDADGDVMIFRSGGEGPQRARVLRRGEPLRIEIEEGELPHGIEALIRRMHDTDEHEEADEDDEGHEHGEVRVFRARGDGAGGIRILEGEGPFLFRLEGMPEGIEALIRRMHDADEHEDADEDDEHEHGEEHEQGEHREVTPPAQIRVRVNGQDTELRQVRPGMFRIEGGHPGAVLQLRTEGERHGQPMVLRLGGDGGAEGHLEAVLENIEVELESAGANLAEQIEGALRGRLHGTPVQIQVHAGEHPAGTTAPKRDDGSCVECPAGCCQGEAAGSGPVERVEVIEVCPAHPGTAPEACPEATPAQQPKEAEKPRGTIG